MQHCSILHPAYILYTFSHLNEEHCNIHITLGWSDFWERKVDICHVVPNVWGPQYENFTLQLLFYNSAQGFSKLWLFKNMLSVRQGECLILFFSSQKWRETILFLFFLCPSQKQFWNWTYRQQCVQFKKLQKHMENLHYCM